MRSLCEVQVYLVVHEDESGVETFTACDCSGAGSLSNSIRAVIPVMGVHSDHSDCMCESVINLPYLPICKHTAHLSLWNRVSTCVVVCVVMEFTSSFDSMASII